MDDVNPGQGLGQAPGASAGWYPHPTMHGTQAYWNGVTWTGQVAPAAPPVDPNSSTLTGLLLVVLAVGFTVLVLWALVQMI